MVLSRMERVYECLLPSLRRQQGSILCPPPLNLIPSSPPKKGLKEKKIRAHFVETIHKIIWVEVFFTVFISSYRNHKKKKKIIDSIKCTLKNTVQTHYQIFRSVSGSSTIGLKPQPIQPNWSVLGFLKGNKEETFLKK